MLLQQIPERFLGKSVHITAALERRYAAAGFDTGTSNIWLVAFDLTGLVLDQRIHAGGRQIKHNGAAKRDKGTARNLHCALAKAKGLVGFHHKRFEYLVFT